MPTWRCPCEQGHENTSVSLRRDSDEKETPRARGGEDCFESVPEDSGTDAESFAAVTAGRDESSASEYQLEESRDLRGSATSASCGHELHWRADLEKHTSQFTEELQRRVQQQRDDLKQSLKEHSANPPSRAIQTTRRGEPSSQTAAAGGQRNGTRTRRAQSPTKLDELVRVKCTEAATLRSEGCNL